jgi:hypothetical protein
LGLSLFHRTGFSKFLSPILVAALLVPANVPIPAHASAADYLNAFNGFANTALQATNNLGMFSQQGGGEAAAVQAKINACVAASGVDKLISEAAAEAAKILSSKDDEIVDKYGRRNSGSGSNVCGLPKMPSLSCEADLLSGPAKDIGDGKRRQLIDGSSHISKTDDLKAAKAQIEQYIQNLAAGKCDGKDLAEIKKRDAARQAHAANIKCAQEVYDDLLAQQVQKTQHQ